MLSPSPTMPPTNTQAVTIRLVVTASIWRPLLVRYATVPVALRSCPAMGGWPVQPQPGPAFPMAPERAQRTGGICTAP